MHKAGGSRGEGPAASQALQNYRGVFIQGLNNLSAVQNPRNPVSSSAIAA